MKQVLDDLKSIKIENNNEIIINELLFQYDNFSRKGIYKRVDFIKFVKEYITLNNKNEYEIFNY
jgi:hypothetical protein